MAGYTPMMEQYFEIKKKHRDCLVFFRLGDFYELFFDDAKIASAELGLTLTGKNCGMEEKAPMCGVPFHSADSYIYKLVEKGHKVAICEQTENPKNAKTIVKREVIRIVTRGTLTDEKALDEGTNNYIMSLYFGKDGTGVSVCDVSTGEFLTTEIKDAHDGKVIDVVAKFNPSEILVNRKNSLTESISSVFDKKCEEYYEWAYERSGADMRLCNHFGVLNLSGFGLEDAALGVCASGALIEYLNETQKNNLSNIRSIKLYSEQNYMILDMASRRNLELTRTMRDKSKKGSLLWVLDKTRTAGGARLIRRWLEQPLIDPAEINKRLDGVEAFKNNVIDREELKEYLAAIYDIERIMSKVVYATANARDLCSLKSSFENLPHIKGLLGAFPSEYIRELSENMDVLEDIYELLDKSIHSDPVFSLREGGIIKDGYNSEVDKLRDALENGEDWVKRVENEEREKTGIKNLRIKYNKVFGYFIEVTNSYRNLVPDRYIRKQTLTGSERYITQEVKEIEEVILGAGEKDSELEYEIFCGIRDKVAAEIGRIQKTTGTVSLIDVLCSLGEAADKNNYIRPVVNNGDLIDIKGGRHPVIELVGRESFIPNDIYIDSDDNRLLVITGPNMAGKSTYMRQTALLVLMAQTGSFIPAESAVIGICDRIFTRVGASDDLATGQSTFMIEMSEVANILNNADKKSLLILDEIGRGTSTYDGLSIAQAVLEYIADKKNIGARTLFATHYHELTELEETTDGVKNYCVAVEERGNDVIFLRKIVRGGTDRSYGIHVARLAGVPSPVLKRAEGILDRLIEEITDRKRDASLSAKGHSDEPYGGENEYDDYNEKGAEPLRLRLDEDAESLVIKELEKADPDNMTPIVALSLLIKLKGMLKK